jgi:acylpyruvate hydrolase
MRMNPFSPQAPAFDWTVGGTRVDSLYRDHITELNSARPKQPFFFLKPASSILPPGTGPVIRPKGVDLHYEVELALIMGKQVKDLEASDEKGALDAIESTFNVPCPLSRGTLSEVGYALSIDMTARNVQNEAKKKGLPWSIAKGFDTFLPVSEIIAKSAIPDPHNVELYLTVNNEHRQADSTTLMLFQIPRILSDISKVMTLEKGDIVLTGTPKGVGPVGPGDIMRAGLKVGGKELPEAMIEVEVKESTSTYEFKET